MQTILPKVLKPESAVLTEPEVQLLLKEAKHPTHRCTARHYLTAQSVFYPAVAFALYMGARWGEIMTMRWSAAHPLPRSPRHTRLAACQSRCADRSHLEAVGPQRHRHHLRPLITVYRDRDAEAAKAFARIVA
jgi:integrase